MFSISRLFISSGNGHNKKTWLCNFFSSSSYVSGHHLFLYDPLFSFKTKKVEKRKVLLPEKDGKQMASGSSSSCVLYWNWFLPPSLYNSVNLLMCSICSKTSCFFSLSLIFCFESHCSLD